MKPVAVVLTSLIVLLLGGCASNQGGSVNDLNTMSSTEGQPAPAASPTMRPGSNPEDPRDAQFSTRQDLSQPPPTH
jgi:hypothetical protein